MYTQDEERRWRWDRFKLRWIVIGDLIKKIEVARFARTLGTLLQSGVSILPAFNLVKEISQNQAISRSISHVHDRLREGKGISKSLEETAVFPPLAVHMIGVGEETGRLDEMLIKVAESYEESVRTAVKRFVSLLEPHDPSGHGRGRRVYCPLHPACDYEHHGDSFLRSMKEAL